MTPSTVGTLERLADTDVLVVGGGVVGSALTYYLAREGVAVTLIDRDDFGASAAGRNAGSLHIQLQSMFFNTDTPAQLAKRIAVLPLMAEAIAEWRRLAAIADCDLEVLTEGGLMVAESDAQMRIIERKVAAEQSAGIRSRVLDRRELLDIAPYLSPNVVGGEFCPDEGKMNPILAIPALVRAAAARGARLLRFAGLEALDRVPGGFEARTARGLIRAKRVVNAAGPFSPEVAAMVGVRLPVTRRCVQGTVSEPVAPIVRHLVYHAERVLTFKQAANGNLIIGGGWPARFDATTGFPANLLESVQANMWVALQVIPFIANLRLLRTWGGINLRADGMPILGGVPGVPGFFCAVPSEAGFTQGPLCARLLAETLTGRNATFDIRPFAIDRFAAARAA